MTAARRRGTTLPAASRIGAGLVGALVVSLLGGCGDDVGARDLADALSAQAWPGGEAELGVTPGGRTYPRPAVTRATPVTQAPWQAVADEVARAVDAGWVPVFAQCTGPRDSVRVDLVRPLEVGGRTTVAAATVATGLEWADLENGRDPSDDVVLSVQAVAPAPQDLDDDALLPAALRAVPDAVDASACLDGPPADDGRTWVGEPAALPPLGGPLPR